MQECEFYIEGMHCAACEILIEKKLGQVAGVKKVDAKLAQGKVHISSTKELSPAQLSKLVEADGYRITGERVDSQRVKYRELGLGLLIAVVFFSAFLLLQKLGIVNLVGGNGQVTYPFIFFIGVIASLSTCMAVVGGLVLSLSSNYSREHQTRPLLLFHLSRVVGFFILGGVIGLLGAAFVLTPLMSFILSLILFFVMLILAVNMLEILPVTKRLQLKMPKFIGKKALAVGDNVNMLTPVLLGAATFFLPCGFTQSMQIYSLTTGNFLSGALTMLVFALGTLPVLALISFASTKLSKTLQSGLFYRAAGFIIIFFAVFNLLAAFVAIGLLPPLFNI